MLDILFLIVRLVMLIQVLNSKGRLLTEWHGETIPRIGETVSNQKVISINWIISPQGESRDVDEARGEFPGVQITTDQA
jgi:hypothetical protein